MEKYYKIEVAKNNGNFYYTGVVENDPSNDAFVIVKTLRGENLKFRREQIMQQELIDYNIKLSNRIYK